MNDIADLRSELEEIKRRNQRVEADKAWETSLSRKILIATLTYFLIVIFLFTADLPKPFINAIIPAIGFILSTLSLPLFKKIWLKLANHKK